MKSGFLASKTLLWKLNAASETEVVDRLSSHTGCTRELRSFIQFAVRRPALSKLEEKLLASRTHDVKKGSRMVIRGGTGLEKSSGNSQLGFVC